AKVASDLAYQLRKLEEEVDRHVAMSDLIDERIKEVNVNRDVGAMNVEVMEFAGPSEVPSFPIPSRFFAAGILLGGMAGFGLAWLRDLLDHRLRSVEEIAEVLQLPILGALPQMGGTRDRSRGGRTVALEPRSTLAEAIRTLRTAVHFGLAGDDVRTILVTSPSPGDGKSTTTSNLAIAMAQAGQKVLLIDADLRKPTQHQIFEADPEIGLSTILTERRPAREAILRDVIEELDLLPCGPIPPNPVELLNNGYFDEVLRDLLKDYDRIIVDSAPVMPVADSRVVAAITDATILVLRAERSTRRLALGARNELWKVRAQRLGVVVNRVPMRKQTDYGYGGYGGRYGASYGYSGGYGSSNYSKEQLAARKKSRALPKPEPEPEVVGTDEG
ncbi:MAG: polysaccharide biosynthesis tyrosine autokinase, partial [Planctomycetota bacterium]